MADCIKTVAPKAINADGLQIRSLTSREHIDNIAELFDEDAPTWPVELPPVTVFHDGKTYWLADGHHRLAAAVETGCQEIRVNIRKGTRDEAILYACGANADHGLPRTNADKRRAVMAALKIHPNNTARAIAKLCRVGHSAVSNIIRELRHPKGELSTVDKNEKDEASSPVAGGADERRGGNPDQDAEKPSTRKEGAAKIANLPVESTAQIAQPEPASTRPLITAEQIQRETIYTPPSEKPASEPFAESIDFFGQLESVIQQAQRLVNQIATMRGAELYRGNHLRTKQTTRNGESVETFYSPDLANALAELRHWRPHAVCPRCGDLGATQHDCAACKGLGWVTEDGVARCPKK